jgi:hypothetical protein
LHISGCQLFSNLHDLSRMRDDHIIYQMATLQQDIKKQSDWIVKSFKTDFLWLDYTIESFKQIDQFFNLHSKDGQPVEDGRLAQNTGLILFSIGSYVGETLIKNIPGSVWVTDDNDLEGEINASVLFPDSGQVWPMQKVIKRFRNGEIDGIYAYGALLAKKYVKVDEVKKKSWWRFW